MARVNASEIAAFLALPLVHGDGPVDRPDDLSTQGPGGMVWLRALDRQRVEDINAAQPALVICDAASAEQLRPPCIVSQNPRLSFIRALARFFAEEEESGIHPTAVVEPGARLGAHVSVGAYARIGPDVTIGDGTAIGSGVALEGRVVIGRRCRIKPNAVIGAPGFGFERDEEGVPVHFPHVGSVEIGDEVWIGSCSTVERAALGVTRILAGVKVDDLVQIGHNTTVGENTLVMANVVLCGGAVVEEGCWISPNSVIKQKVRIGRGATVGLGAVVLKDVAEGSVVAGAPARPLPRKR
jgi:UDP-3-O-[3-hydroxymyristoyl] glucosamine N-acyltransferase